MLETGLRVGELVALLKIDVDLDPIGSARFGYLKVRDGKTKNAKRSISLTQRASLMLRARMESNDSEWVFPGDPGKPFLATSLNHLHSKVRATTGLSGEFVLHSLRHTFLTRLGEQGVDAFTIMKIAGHASITTSQRYIHPSSEAMERAFERLENDPNRPVATTIPTTPAEPVSDRVM